MLSSDAGAGRAGTGQPTPLGQRVTIGAIARDFGVSLRALRFYEDRGLLRPYRRGTARFYDERDRRHLKLILKGKQFGFTLTEIQEMLRSLGSESDAADLESALLPEQIAAQISHLERQRDELDAAINALRHAHQGASQRAAKDPSHAARRAP